MQAAIGPATLPMAHTTPAFQLAAQVSRNHEAQTTPRRAADAAFQQVARQQAQAQAHAAAQQEQLLRQHQAAAAAQQQHAVLKAGATSPRAVNVDATTGGLKAGPAGRAGPQLLPARAVQLLGSFSCSA